jgi:hypothetical protein
MAVVLVHHLAVRVAEGADGRHVQDPRDPGLHRRVEHALGSAHVGVLHGRAVPLGDAHLVDGADVEDGVGALAAPADRVGGGEVAGDGLDAEVAGLLG